MPPLVLRLPTVLPLGFLTGRMFLMMALVTSLAVGSMLVGLILRGGTLGVPGRAVLLGGAMSVGIGVTVILMGRQTVRRQVQASRAALAGRGPDGVEGQPMSAERAIVEELHEAVLRDRIALRKSRTHANWLQFRETVAARTGSVPSTIVDLSYSEGADPLPPPATTLFEPEPIDESQSGMLIPAVIFGALALLSVIEGGAGRGTFFSRGWGTLVFAALCVYFLSRSPKVRNAIPILRDTGRDLVAGPGWIRDRKGSRWTVDDSTAILFAPTTKNGALTLRLVGPSGVRDLGFASAKDPDFRMLWERWTTTEPRLELNA
jgi:hypothetical protein